MIEEIINIKELTTNEEFVCSPFHKLPYDSIFVQERNDFKTKILNYNKWPPTLEEWSFAENSGFNYEILGLYEEGTLWTKDPITKKTPNLAIPSQYYYVKDKSNYSEVLFQEPFNQLNFVKIKFNKGTTVLQTSDYSFYLLKNGLMQKMKIEKKYKKSIFLDQNILFISEDSCYMVFSCDALLQEKDRFPGTAPCNFFSLGENEIAYFSRYGKRKNQGFENVVLNKVNLITKAHQSVVLSDFGNHSTRSKTVDYLGWTEVLKGHGDWFILNYVTAYSGQKDIAWLWNTQTNQVLKLTSRHLTKWKNEISSLRLRYNKCSGRYYAVSADKLFLFSAWEQLQTELQQSILPFS